MSGTLTITNTAWTVVPSKNPVIELNNLARMGDVHIYVGQAVPDMNVSDYQLWTSENLTRLVGDIPAQHRVYLRTANNNTININWRSIEAPDLVNLPDEKGYGLIGSVAKRFVDDFGGVALDTTKWEVELDTGSITYAVTNSDLTVQMGTTANAELRLLSKSAFTIPVDIFIGATLSQRLSENGIYFELVEVDAAGVPVANPNLAGDWNNRVALRFTASTSTGNMGLESVSQGSNLVSSLVSSTAQATTGTVDFQVRVRECDVWASSVGIDSNAGRGNGEIRLSRQVPDPDKIYKLRMRFKNAGSAPGSSTTVSVRSIRVLDIQEVQVDLASSGSGAAGNGVPISGSVPIIPNQGTSTLAGTISHRLVSAASTNLTSIKSSAGKLLAGVALNTNAAPRYMKFYNKSSAPVLASDVPIFVIPLLTNIPVCIADIVGITGFSFSSGITYAITGGLTDTDTAAIGAGDVILNLSFV